MKTLRARVADAELKWTTSHELSEAVTRTGLSTRAVARAIGIKSSELRAYMRGRRECPYPVQFAVESLLPVFVVESQICGEWENIWSVNDEPQTFLSHEAAFAEIQDHLSSLDEADMTSLPMRIVTL